MYADSPFCVSIVGSLWAGMLYGGGRLGLPPWFGWSRYTLNWFCHWQNLFMVALCWSVLGLVIGAFLARSAAWPVLVLCQFVHFLVGPASSVRPGRAHCWVWRRIVSISRMCLWGIVHSFAVGWGRSQLCFLFLFFLLCVFFKWCLLVHAMSYMCNTLYDRKKLD